LYIFKRIKRPIATADDNFFQIETHLIWIVLYDHILMQIMYQVCSKNIIPSKHYYNPLFPVKLHKMPLSILIKARSHDLPWLILSHWGSEVCKHQFQFTERSLAACNRYCHRQHQGCGSGSCGSGSAKILPLPLPHRLFDTFCV